MEETTYTKTALKLALPGAPGQLFYIGKKESTDKFVSSKTFCEKKTMLERKVSKFPKLNHYFYG